MSNRVSRKIILYKVFYRIFIQLLPGNRSLSAETVYDNPDMHRLQPGVDRTSNIAGEVNEI